jgi:hypothetical protein
MITYNDPCNEYAMKVLDRGTLSSVLSEKSDFDENTLK